jgi:uncharacterized protein with HEPN domain
MQNSPLLTRILNGKKWQEQEISLSTIIFGVDYDIVWNIVETKLPALKEFIDGLFNDINPD